MNPVKPEVPGPSPLGSVLSDQPPEVTHRQFGDHAATRQSISDNVSKALTERYPIENKRYRLEVHNVGWQNQKPFSLDEQKKAIMRGHTLEHKLTGDWHLVDKASGNIVDKKSGVIAHVPWLTERGTYIYNGSEMSCANQMRLRPGVYARQRDNGEVEAHVNVKPGTGPSFRVHLEPHTGVFRLGVGQSNLKLYPILKSMGASDKDIAGVWGDDLLARNIEAEDPRAVSRAFMRLVSTRADHDAGGEDTDALKKLGEAKEAVEFSPSWTCTFCDSKLGQIPCDMYEGHHFHRNCLSGATLAQKAKALLKLKTSKEASLRSAESDRKWSYLWHTGKLAASGHNGEDWVLLEVHKGLCDAAHNSVKSEGIDCDPHFSNPHISVMRPEEIEQLKKKFGQRWQGAAKIGQSFRFRLEKIVNLIPRGWKGMDRVWFLECASPELEAYRKDLGLTALPRSPDDPGHEMRFHVTFAVRRSQNRKAAALLELIQRSERDESEDFDKEAAENDPGKMLAGVFNKMELDPEVTQATLGQRHKTASIPMILRTSQKLLNINKGTEETDDRDSLAFQTLHSAEDLFAERIRRDAGQIGRKLLWKSTLKGNLQHMPSGPLTPQIRSVLLKSGLANNLEEINPMDAYDQNQRILRLGEGGISSEQAVPDEARSVQPSHFGFIDPIRSPESSKIGVDARITHGALKGSDGQFYTTMTDPKTGKRVHVSAPQAARSIVAFPGEFERNSKKVRAMVNAHQIEHVDRDKVHFVLPHSSQMFNASSNLVPLVSSIKGGRLLMGAKYVTQALPIKDAEAQLVQNIDEHGRSFNDMYGEHVGAIRAKDRGVVHAIDKTGITVMYPGGKKEVHQLYDNFPFNRKSFLHNTPTVGIGDQVSPGQLLARSNYTDEKGALAIGTNLRTAYLPYKGLNFEDAIVISDSAAKRLSSEHMYQKNHDVDEDTDVGRKQYVSMYPSRFKPEQLQQIGHEGVIKPGSVVKKGDPLVLSLKKAKNDAIHKGHKPMWSDNVTTWDHHADGVVTDVDKTKEGGWNVTVKSYMPAQEGDKLSGYHGDKGVISRIVPDHKMVHDKDGNPFHILLNPLGVISRANPAQVFEAVLGKIARKTGQAYKLPGFFTHDAGDPKSSKNVLEYVQSELQKHGMSDTEDLTDPETGRKIPKVLTGERFIMKLHHTAEAKNSGRDVGSYTSEGIPAKGGPEGAKRIAGMETASLLSHGAREVLRDAQTVRGQRNDDYWRAFRMGNTPPAPKVPFVYNKFLGYLKGAGINVEKTGNRLRIFAMTNKDVDKMSAGEITTPDTVSGDKLTEIPGGLFDRYLTGGHGGEKWSHIALHDPLPNPVMEEPIRNLLGVTQNKFEDILSGKEKLGDRTGSAAIQEALSRVNVEDSIKHYEDVIRSGPKTRRDKAIKALGYLKGLQRGNLQPSDLLLSKVPVVPPNMRPITAYRNMTMPADANMLYKDLMMANKGYKLVKDGAGEDAAGEERLRLYNAFKAVTGMGDPISEKLQDKGVKGLLSHVFGKGSPKTGLFQRRVLGSPVDMVGRASITPNSDMDMDHVGIPEKSAWTIYRPFVMRRLLRRGMPATEAARNVADQTKLARDAMEEEMGERPVIINRAPTLHRYGFMASWPKLVKNDTLQLSPVVCSGFNADFDGDAMNFHVPVTEGAVKDAIEKMMPSRNLHSVRDFKVHYTPKNEFLLGLHLASGQDNKNEHRIFKDKASALAAYRRGELGVGDRIEIHGA